jgi:hypothetical protein
MRAESFIIGVELAQACTRGNDGPKPGAKIVIVLAIPQGSENYQYFWHPASVLEGAFSAGAPRLLTDWNCVVVRPGAC